MKNVQAMLFRAMNYKTDEYNPKLSDAGRNDHQSGIGTRETYQSKTTEITQRIGNSQSNSQLLERPGIEISTLSMTNNLESRKDLQEANTGEQKLQQELERI